MGWREGIFHHCCLALWYPVLLSPILPPCIHDVMTYPDLWNDFSFVRSRKRRRSAYGDVPQFNDLTSQYPILLSLAENLSILDLVNLGLASKTTWTHLSASKRPLRLRGGVAKTALKCEGLHIQPRPQSPHQGTPYVLPCASSQMVPVKRCEGCGVAVCEVSRLIPNNIKKIFQLTFRPPGLPLQPNTRSNAHLHAQTPLVLPLAILLPPRYCHDEHRNNARQHGAPRPHRAAQQQRRRPHHGTTLHAPEPALRQLLHLHRRIALARPLALRPLPQPRHLPRAHPRGVLCPAPPVLARNGLPTGQ